MYKLNPNVARQADQINARISESGKYVGRFTRAEHVVSSRGTQGIEFSFVADDGQTADFLQIWTLDGAGKEIFGFRQLNSLMTCLEAKEIAPEEATVEKYDFEERKIIPSKAMVFKSLMGKPIGLVLQKEFYKNNNGETKERMLIFGVFRAADGFTASEILDRAKSPEKLDKILAGLRDRHSENRGSTASTGGTSQAIAPAGMNHTLNQLKALQALDMVRNAGSDFDDDIPF